MGKLIVLVGTTLSGKTTWAKQFKNAYHISRDTERESLFGEYRMGSQKEEDVITDIINNKVWTCLKLGDVILDNTHCNQIVLDNIVSEFGSSYDIEFKLFPALTKEELIKRNHMRFFETGKLIPERVIHKQLQSFNELVIPKNIINHGTKTDRRVLNNLKYDPTLKDCVIFDLDGTISLMNGRNPFKGENCSSDVVNESVKRLVECIPDFVDVFIFSGRNSDNGAMDATIEWLSNNGLPYHDLIMREEKDNRPDIVIKKEMYNKHIKDKYNVIFTVDDRDCVVKMWRDMGIDCFQVNYGNF